MLNMKWTVSAIMLAAALAGTTPQASAQSQHYRGDFDLPFEARFGNVILQPGSYTVSMLEGAKGIRITGDKGSVSILAASYDLTPGTEKGRMVLVDSHGIYALRSFESGAIGKALHFPVWKNPRGAAERTAAKLDVGMP
ncbi:MAG TPA: hypothetical protein VMT15_13915 [Bryobacteraceae bacterium]|nr:hypothetical protein [Bryobacteraceae bacterium]